MVDWIDLAQGRDQWQALVNIKFWGFFEQMSTKDSVLWRPLVWSLLVFSVDGAVER
jgi:hypothetical protein